MPTFSQLKQAAISATKTASWEQAVELNLAALEQKPDDIGTLNRLGVAYLGLGQSSKAKSAFQQVIALDRSNQVAIKNMTRLKTKQQPELRFTQQHFIEEPGKTKVVELHRLASKEVLQELRVGTPCELKVKKRYISVETQGHYVGALPEDLSFRLTKLLESGNEYQALIWAATATNCSIYLREVLRSSKNTHTASFPCSRAQMQGSDEYDPLLTEDFPVDLAPDEDTTESVDTNILLQQ